MTTQQRPRVVIIGPPGAGKTTVALLVAERLGVPHHDTDTAIEVAERRSVSDIFIDDGEPRFRALEQAAVADALDTQVGVVSIGGGAPLDPRTEALLRGHRVVFLDVGIADASRRIGFGASRPLLAVNPRGSWIAMMKERRTTYERVATYRVDTAGRTPEEVAAEVVAVLEAPA